MKCNNISKILHITLLCYSFLCLPIMALEEPQTKEIKQNFLEKLHEEKLLLKVLDWISCEDKWPVWVLNKFFQELFKESLTEDEKELADTYWRLGPRKGSYANLCFNRAIWNAQCFFIVFKERRKYIKEKAPYYTLRFLRSDIGIENYTETLEQLIRFKKHYSAGEHVVQFITHLFHKLKDLPQCEAGYIPQFAFNPNNIAEKYLFHIFEQHDLKWLENNHPFYKYHQTYKYYEQIYNEKLKYFNDTIKKKIQTESSFYITTKEIIDEYSHLEKPPLADEKQSIHRFDSLHRNTIEPNYCLTTQQPCRYDSLKKTRSFFEEVDKLSQEYNFFLKHPNYNFELYWFLLLKHELFPKWNSKKMCSFRENTSLKPIFSHRLKYQESVYKEIKTKLEKNINRLRVYTFFIIKLEQPKLRNQAKELCLDILKNTKLVRISKVGINHNYLDNFKADITLIPTIWLWLKKDTLLENIPVDILIIIVEYSFPSINQKHDPTNIQDFYHNFLRRGIRNVIK